MSESTTSLRSPRDWVGIAHDTPVIVDLGCGRNPHPDSNVRIDNREDTDANIVHDLEEGIPFHNSSVDTFYAFDVLEHISQGLVDLMSEIHRTLRPGGSFVARVPHESNDPPSMNPLHSRSFRPEWFYSWDPNRVEHSKWDNFTCIPFEVELTQNIKYDTFPFKYYKILTREFTMKKISHCSRHPTIQHDDVD
jgi:SAM-dependent methyltransferase